MEEQLHGILPALLTPFDEAGEIDYVQVERLVQYQQALGAEGFFVCGQSGEHYLLSEEERQQMLRVVREQCDGIVIAHVGHTDCRLAQRLAEHAWKHGADAVASCIPAYYTRQDALDYYRQLCQATPLPLIAYVFAGGAELVDDAFLEEAASEERFAGFKFTSYDFYKMGRICSFGPDRFTVFSGPDELFAPANLMGAHGGIGSTYNIMVDLFCSMRSALQDGRVNDARKLQHLANRVIYMLQQASNGATVYGLKTVLGFLGYPCATPRLAGRRLNADQQAQCRQALALLEETRSSMG